MASLLPNRAGSASGAQYMDEAFVDSRIMTDVEPILASSGDGNFKKLQTIPVFSIHLCVSVIISFVGIGLAVSWPEEKRGEAYFIMTSLRVAFWLVTFLFDHLIRKRHNDLRMNGYHDFHRSMVMHNGIALNVVSAWNTLLLLVQALLHHYYGNVMWNTWFTPVTCIVSFQLSETFILMTTHGCYMVKVYKFNKNANAPDALMGTDSSAGSLGLMQPGGNVAELLEKQADLIAYLKDHNQTLNQKLHHMQLHTRVTHLGH
ncbi:transmembrane protein 192 [Musca domestica]|uniref:Transmembrane protein 192 n=1 Tax=Musca domestica TaxID=7370 RepID=A0A1I8MMT1_MUSDO|nr:transmembrane protein 192 [Musca domestica]XP_058976977.1 transmembrane protein 192 [Musca domestica]